MAILITGGTGKTGSRIIPLLQAAKIPFLIASRKGAVSSGLPATKFDWDDASTYKNPFSHQFPNNEKITAIYLISPESADPVPVMNAFIDVAVKEGVKRFVMLSGTTLTKGGYYTGKVWSHLDEVGVEYAILRATWFDENFSEWQHKGSIKDESKIYSAVGDGKVPFVSAADIARVAFHALTDEKIYAENIKIVGPELLTHDEVAKIFSTVLGREITHVKLSSEERIQSLLKIGMPEHYAKFMTQLEVTSSEGFEDAMDDTVVKVTGKKPQALSEWIEENKSAW